MQGGHVGGNGEGNRGGAQGLRARQWPEGRAGATPIGQETGSEGVESVVPVAGSTVITGKEVKTNVQD